LFVSEFVFHSCCKIKNLIPGIFQAWEQLVIIIIFKTKNSQTKYICSLPYKLCFQIANNSLISSNNLQVIFLLFPSTNFKSTKKITENIWKHCNDVNNAACKVKVEHFENIVLSYHKKNMYCEQSFIMIFYKLICDML
jgi:hypothetical protein